MQNVYVGLMQNVLVADANKCFQTKFFPQSDQLRQCIAAIVRIVFCNVIIFQVNIQTSADNEYVDKILQYIATTLNIM